MFGKIEQLKEEEMEQTAVEWFYDRVEFDGSLSMLRIRELYIQAKQMEKKQIIDAVDDWVFNGTKKGEQYYNETYGE
jgi:hypothetical protein